MFSHLPPLQAVRGLGSRMKFSRRKFLQAGIGTAATLRSTARGTRDDLPFLSISELSGLMRTRKISPVEVTSVMLDRIEKLNPILNAYVTVTADLAMKSAQEAEREIQRGKWRGPLHGVPIALKDLYGLPTISVPCGFTRNGLPIGLQISGPNGGEAAILQLAHAYEQATEWHKRRPAMA